MMKMMKQGERKKETCKNTWIGIAWALENEGKEGRDVK
jgi:hypothetical protein